MLALVVAVSRSQFVSPSFLAGDSPAVVVNAGSGQLRDCGLKC